MANIQDSLWGKMSPDYSAPQTEKTSAQSSKKSAKSKMTAVSVPRPPERWTKAGEIVGEDFSVAWRALDAQYWESPSEEQECTLSQILQDSVHPIYYLSAKACLGILRRASERGKELPAVLKKALEQQAGLTQS